jgi:hypothetical protein
LSKQLEISARDSQLVEEHRQKERDYYKERWESFDLEIFVEFFWCSKQI